MMTRSEGLVVEVFETEGIRCAVISSNEAFTNALMELTVSGVTTSQLSQPRTRRNCTMSEDAHYAQKDEKTP